MKIKKLYSKLCPPAQLYLILSLISIFCIFLSNARDQYQLSMGSYSASLSFSNLYIIFNI